MQRKILIIDNDEDTLSVIAYVLEECGYEIITSLSGNILIDILAIDPDLIILDNWLGEVRGGDLCKKLKSNTHTKNIPVVLISAANGLEFVSRECGADNYLNKPFEIDDMINTVNALLYPEKSNQG